MRFRFHRGGLAESMATAIEVGSEAELCAHIRAATAWTRLPAVYEGDLQVTPYGYDSRIDWDTYIVKAPGFGLGVIGFTDGPL